ncbi:asialoglycoprotein receptor 2-like isoform X6 [Ascaphus truei]|uniref:asialoglycoprotein receptor 2-like isoform X6 n=1 Tax=Ascaphus truei TaxID=8439 RepID=UPI003F594702
MDSDCSPHERFHDDMIFSDRGIPFHRRKPVVITYGLLILSYILILALFITVLSKFQAIVSKIEAQSSAITSNIVMKLKSEVQTIGEKAETVQSDVKTDILQLKSQVADLSSKLAQLDTTPKKESCESPWVYYNDNCYFFSTMKSNWMKAKTMCEGKGASLAVITSEEEQKFIYGRTGDVRYWIGLSDLDVEGKWKWIDGTDYTTSYKFWKKGEPNDSMKNEDCAHIWNSGEWNDVHCTYDQCYAICEKKRS